MSPDDQTNPQDPQNMRSHIDTLPDQLAQAWHLGQSLPLPNFGRPEKVLIAGMGGSAIGGDLLASYIANACPIPVFVHRGYDLPAWAQGPSTLVICSSHSGNTEETLSAFDMALERGCSLLTLSTGGKLTEKATSAGISTWIFDHQGQPRTAVGYSFGILLALFTRLGMVAVTDATIADAVAAMKSQQQHIGVDVPYLPTPPNVSPGSWLVAMSPCLQLAALKSSPAAGRPRSMSWPKPGASLKPYLKRITTPWQVCSILKRN